jgi:chromosome segregation ATPase
MTGEPLSDTQQLLDLLQRAAEELKSAQQQADDAGLRAQQLEVESKAHRARVRQLERELEDVAVVRQRVQALEAALDEARRGVSEIQLLDSGRGSLAAERSPSRGDLTQVGPPPSAPRPGDDKTNVSSDGDLLAQRFAGLQDELRSVEDERRALKERVRDLEALLAAARDELQQPTHDGPAPGHGELDEALADARAQLERERARADELAQRLEAYAHDVATPPRREDDEATSADGTSLDAQLRIVTARAEADAQRLVEAMARAQALEGELEQASAARQQLAEALAEAQAREAVLAAHAAQADGGQQQLAEALARVQALDGELEAERGRRAAAQGQVQSLEAELEALDADARSEQQRRVDATARVAQLEAELAAVRARRDELNVELSHVERARNEARALAEKLQRGVDEVRGEEAELREALERSARDAMDAEVARRAALEADVQKEKDKHQATAQRLLDARQRQRELEGQVEKLTAQVTSLEAQAQQAQREHARALEAQALSAQAASAQLAERVTALEGQLEHATSEWRHADRQYEQLHKEMLALLDQRDEARAELEQLRQQKPRPGRRG